MVVRIERLRRDRKWPARRIALELTAEGVAVSVRTVGRHLALCLPTTPSMQVEDVQAQETSSAHGDGCHPP
ncbi:hypothetical protein BN6_28770 [Saccharothrix espanaensis DSM 44229]|uniref:Uncharacterized protein n=1 Tax=Saccharothrix espanaensis (strain ATCC 51144 / DSM 44229 / JCM 9112 / NBRC 15066 / NRRL 15764) TaxID=1179773 RepID=K0JW05_SACES|nr:hypothetical protein BN6_28770 [Saccharothrix espanaensis DSM 44229]